MSKTRLAGLSRTVLLGVALGLLGAAVSAAAEPPNGQQPGPKRETWVGRSLEQLQSVWGEAVQVKPMPEGRTLYRFRYRVSGLESFNLGDEYPSDYGIGPSQAHLDERIFDPAPLPPAPFSGDVDQTVATIKARFWVDQRGVVVAEEIGKVKWKKGYGPRKRRPR